MKGFYMKKTLVMLVIIACFDLLSSSAYAQKKFASIEKNVNASANELFHDLNTSKDTLILSGDKWIRKVYSINQDYKRETDEYINSNSVKLPLTHLSKGKHVFVVEQMPMKIVFVIKVFRDKELDSKLKDGKRTAARNDD